MFLFVLSDAKKKYPNVDFEPYAIDLRRKFEARVDGQIKRANANVKKWERSKKNVKAVKPIDDLLIKLYQEEKINEQMKKQGFSGMLPPQKKRKTNDMLRKEGYQEGYADGYSQPASSQSGATTEVMSKRMRVFKKKNADERKEDEDYRTE